MSPTQRSKALLEQDGWTVAIVERWNPHVRVRQDLWGFADLIAMKPGHAPKLVQVTSGSNVASRISKIREEPHARVALESGFSIEVHGWRKLKVKRGGKAVRWTPRIEPVTREDFACRSTLSDGSPASAP